MDTQTTSRTTPHTTTRRSGFHRGLAGIGAAAAIVLAGAPALAGEHPEPDRPWLAEQSAAAVAHRTVEIDGLEIFYREAGDPQRPTVLLLHGFPTSSHMFRDLIPQLAERYHVLAPDYPGYGHSSMPAHDEYDYTFHNLSVLMDKFVEAKGVDEFALYLMDYGAPIGYRMFERDPERVTAFLVQNGNAYEEGLAAFWDPIKAYWSTGGQEERDALRAFLTREATIWQYTTGVRNPEAISPDTWDHVQPLLDRPGNQEIQLDLFYDYRTNVDRYPRWQELFREHRVPTLIVWGKNDPIFPDSGAYPYLRDLEDIEFHLFNTGHFALEEDGALIGDLIVRFLGSRVE